MWHTFRICQKFASRPYFATKSHAVMVDHWSTSNNYSWFSLWFIILTWGKSIMLIQLWFHALTVSVKYCLHLPKLRNLTLLCNSITCCDGWSLSTFNNYSWFLLWLMILTWGKSIMLIQLWFHAITVQVAYFLHLPKVLNSTLLCN
jgi:hypothetical protein